MAQNVIVDTTQSADVDPDFDPKESDSDDSTRRSFNCRKRHYSHCQKKKAALESPKKRKKVLLLPEQPRPESSQLKLAKTIQELRSRLVAPAKFNPYNFTLQGNVVEF